jgi:hypothetical protein
MLGDASAMADAMGSAQVALYHQGRLAALPAPPGSARERPFPQEIKLLHNRAVSVTFPGGGGMWFYGS